MIELRETRSDELPSFCIMDRDADTRDHITVNTLDEHQREFARDDIVYLSILVDSQLGGYFILALEAKASVEVRRIVVANKSAGIGQAAIRAMENYCGETLRCRRIWLDVFESNARARHVYDKLGYRRFDTGELDGRKLMLLQKRLDDLATN